MSVGAKWVGFSAVAVAVLLGSCSGDDGDSDGGNKSGSANGGSSNAGSSNAGGGNKAGSSGSASGGSASGSGGSGNNAGRGGMGGFTFGGSLNLGGAGFDPEEFMCDPAPTPGTDCDSEAQPCFDGTDVCYCAAGEWACMDPLGGGGGAGPGGQECPDSKPTNGSPCEAFAICPYGGPNEGCACDGSMWACIP